MIFTIVYTCTIIFSSFYFSSIYIQIAAKRGGGKAAEVYDELSECISSGNNVEEKIDREHLTSVINEYLSGIEREKRIIFVKRYWYMVSIGDIASEYQMSESKVKSMLFRMRGELKDLLAEEGIIV